MTSSEELFTQLYGRYRDELHAFCMRRVDRVDVDDVMAEVFAVVWRKIGSVKPGKERAWLRDRPQRDPEPVAGHVTAATAGNSGARRP